MNENHIDIGNFQDDPDKLYSLCIQLSAISDTTVWDRGSQLYRQFHDLLNDLWAQLPICFTVDFRDTEEPSLQD